MIHKFINLLLYDLNYFQVWGITFLYFFILYFGLAPLFEMVCVWLFNKKIIRKIIEKPISPNQIKFEIKHSLQSIFVFGFSGIPVIYLIRHGYMSLLHDAPLNIVLGVLVLNLWNEIHFFVIHRIMHLPFFMKNVHAIHHKSNVPTIYSVYSFHWFEALLLSSVPITIVPFIPFAPIAIFIYPFTSIILNYSGHCNYRFGNGLHADWKIFGTKHAEHHHKNRKNFGFATGFLDWVNSRYSSTFTKSKT